MSRTIRSPNRPGALGRWLAGALPALLALLLSVPCAAGTVKIGVLKFGTVNWELDVIRHHGLDVAQGIDLEIVELAANSATTVALQAGAVDMIVTDWLWVSRQRADGADLTFVPYSKAVGSLVVPADSPIRGIADLAGRRLGIAGGPVDKSWLLFRALAAERDGLDLDSAVEKVFGAPPLLNEQIALGKIDAVINYWHFVAKLEAKGYRVVMGANEAARALGIASEVPLIGFAFSEAWAATHRADVLGMMRASREAKALLARSDSEWDRLRPLMQAEDDATFQELRDGFRKGIPARWGDAERADAVRLYDIMAELGGDELVGRSTTLQPGTFWPEFSY